MMMTYVSPILGGVLAACFIYCISATGFLEGMDTEEKKKEEGATNMMEGEEEDEEEDDGAD